MTLRNLSERRPFSVIGHAFSNLLMQWGGGMEGQGSEFRRKGGNQGLGDVRLRGRQNAVPLKMATPRSPEPANMTSREKWDLADVSRLRISRRGDYPGLSSWPSGSPKVIIIRRGQEARGQSQRDVVAAAEVT